MALMAAVLLVALGSLTVAGRWSAVVLEQARAQTVADLGALGAAVHGMESASRISRANGADVRSVQEVDGTYVVAITLGGVRAEAAAKACVAVEASQGSSGSGMKGAASPRCR